MTTMFPQSISMENGEVVRDNPDSHQEVAEALLEEGVNHIPEPVQLVEEGSRPKRSTTEQQERPGDV